MFIEINCRSMNESEFKPMIINKRHIVHILQTSNGVQITISEGYHSARFYTNESYETLKKSLLDLKF